jgi:C_GCAxxG_C_C family probable redox protein
MSSKDYFAQVAGDWDQMRAGFYSEAVREAALRLAGVRPGQAASQTAADLGAGTGFVTEALLAAGLSVAAVDQSPDMLARLMARFGASGRVITLTGAAEALPLPDASVDFVLANMYLHHVDDPGRAIAEMARVVRPGGRVVLTDLDSHSHEFLLREHHDRWPGFARPDVAAWLTAAGLQNAQVDCAGAEGTGSGEVCCADSCDGTDSARVSIFAAHATRPLCPIPASQADPLAAGARARELFDAAAPLLCAESVLQAVAEALGVHSPLIPRLATGFCSGLSRTCGPCGALNGGIMALGLALGRDSGRDSLDQTYGPVQDYLEWFRASFPATGCRELTDCDLGTAEGQRGFREGGAKQKVCLPVVGAATAQVVRVLAEHQAEHQAD